MSNLMKSLIVVGAGLSLSACASLTSTTSETMLAHPPGTSWEVSGADYAAERARILKEDRVWDTGSKIIAVIAVGGIAAAVTGPTAATVAAVP